jgi:hypothetical protein
MRVAGRDGMGLGLFLFNPCGVTDALTRGGSKKKGVGREGGGGGARLQEQRKNPGWLDERIYSVHKLLHEHTRSTK